MLEFTVNGHLPGEELTPALGSVLNVHARALVGSPAVKMGKLEIVVNGDVIRSVAQSGNSATLSFELSAGTSMWIAARVAGAHTTPIYVTVNGKRHWKLTDVPALLEKRLSTLDEIKELIDQNGVSIDPAKDPIWEKPEAFRRGREQLREMVREARAVYVRLRQKAKADQ